MMSAQADAHCCAKKDVSNANKKVKRQSDERSSDVSGDNQCGSSSFCSSEKHQVDDAADSTSASESTAKTDETNEIKSRGFHLNYECDLNTVEDLGPSSKHTILFNHEFLKYADHTGPPPPSTTPNADEWNNNFVKMPFSPHNVNENKQPMWPEIKKRLTLMAETLSSEPDSIHIEYAIKKICAKYCINWNFNTLHYLFNEELEGSKGETLLKDLIPRIAKLALDLPNKIRCPIPILKAGLSQAISLSQEQCACLLANAFFCTFPERVEDLNPASMPFINFNDLFCSSRRSVRNQTKMEKLKCILHYFQRVTHAMPEGVVTFSRQCIERATLPEFHTSDKPLRTPLIRQHGTIEDCTGAVQVDFANKYLGGGVLNTGCVQEEIRFVICPELLVSLLFTECLGPTESATVRGSERFSSYTGYADTFKWADDYVDLTPRDEWRRLYTEVLAIDALYFRYPRLQFDESKVRRELTKCFSGFHVADRSRLRNLPVIATGNWGCGAFHGDRQLKFLIQMMTAAETDRDLVYFTFGDRRTVSRLNLLVEVVRRYQMRVADVYALLTNYANEIRPLKRSEAEQFDLCEFFLTSHPIANQADLNDDEDNVAC